MPLVLGSTLTFVTSLLLFYFFKIFQSVHLCVRFRVRISVRVCVRVSVNVRLRLRLRLGLRFIFYVCFVSTKPVAAGILAAK